MPDTNPDAVKLLSDDEVAEIEARHNAASPGPWSMTWNTSFGPAIWSHGDILVRCEAGLKHSIVSKADPAPQWQKDMDFIRAAREDIPALCATVRALRAENEKLNAIVTAYENQDEEALEEAENL